MDTNVGLNGRLFLWRKKNNDTSSKIALTVSPNPIVHFHLLLIIKLLGGIFPYRRQPLPIDILRKWSTLTLKLDDCIHGTRESMKPPRSSDSMGFSGSPRKSTMFCPTVSFFLVSLVANWRTNSSNWDILNAVFCNYTLVKRHFLKFILQFFSLLETGF